MNRVLFWRFICHLIAAVALVSAALFFVFHEDKALASLLVLVAVILCRVLILNVAYGYFGRDDEEPPPP